MVYRQVLTNICASHGLTCANHLQPLVFTAAVVTGSCVFRNAPVVEYQSRSTVPNSSEVLTHTYYLYSKKVFDVIKHSYYIPEKIENPKSHIPKVRSE